MSKRRVKTQGFVRGKKYRSVRAALRSADRYWIPLAESLDADVKIQKRDGVWIAGISLSQA